MLSQHVCNFRQVLQLLSSPHQNSFIDQLRYHTINSIHNHPDELSPPPPPGILVACRSSEVARQSHQRRLYYHKPCWQRMRRGGICLQPTLLDNRIRNSGDKNIIMIYSLYSKQIYLSENRLQCTVIERKGIILSHCNIYTTRSTIIWW